MIVDVYVLEDSITTCRWRRDQGHSNVHHPYGHGWRTYRRLVHQLSSPKKTFAFLPTQEFEVKQLMNDILTNKGNELNFHNHVRRMSFSIIMTSTYGRRIST